jgi:hypothetical protein
MTYADDALGSDQLDELVLDASLGVALGICLEVTQVTDMALLVGGGTVSLVVRVDYPLSAIPIQLSLPAGSRETYNGVQQRCSRWCYHRKRARACHAQRWRRGR